MQKKYLVKVYESDGTTFVATINPDDLRKEPQFNARINGIYGQCVLELNYAFDDFDEGTSIDYMNVVKIYEFDSVNHADGILIYSGFISRYMPYVRGGQQGVAVTLLSLGTLLNYIYYKTAGGGWTVTHSGDDTAVIMKDIVDYFNTQYSGTLIDYDVGGTTVDTVGNSRDMEFIEKTCYMALEDTLQTAGGGWYWHINKAGVLYLKEKPTSSTHEFTIGKDVEEFRAEKTSETVTNYVLFKWKSGSVTDDDATSISTFGRREQIVSDSGIASATSADAAAQKHVDDNKDEKIKATLIINSNYDIESISVGDTCKVRNFKTGGGTFSDNMLIAGISYRYDKIQLQLEEYTNIGTALNTFVNS